MKEFVYHVSDEEKLPLFLNRVLSSPDDQFVLFSKDRKVLMKLFDICKEYSINYSHLQVQSSSTAFKNYNEKKNKIFFISDEDLEKKSFFIPETNQVIHYDLPSHPLIYERRNNVIKNKSSLKLIHLYCVEKEYQDFKAIEVYFDKKIQLGKIRQRDIILPQKRKISMQKRRIYDEYKKPAINKERAKVKSRKILHRMEHKEIQKPPTLWEKLILYFKKLFRKPK